MAESSSEVSAENKGDDLNARTGDIEKSGGESVESETGDDCTGEIGNYAVLRSLARYRQIIEPRNTGIWAAMEPMKRRYILQRSDTLDL